MQTELTKEQIITDKLNDYYWDCYEILSELDDCSEVTPAIKKRAKLIHNEIFKFVLDLQKKDYRYHVPIEDIAKRGIAFYHEN